MKQVMKVLKMINSRMFIFGMLILFQLGFLVYCAISWNKYSYTLQIASSMLSLILVVYVSNRPGSASTKIPWIILLCLMPAFGVLAFVLCGNNKVHILFNRSLKKSMQQTSLLHVQDEHAALCLKKADGLRYRECDYLFRNTKMPVHINTTTKYYPSTEEAYVDLLEDLRNAKHFIFMEYFIVSEGQMWDSILEILKQKVTQGVEVRFMYDDIGCVSTLSHNYYQELASFGMQCRPFNPFSPIVAVGHNNRDHRKITVIDGYIGYTGGFNLSDEYINVKERFGYWKDSGLRLEGEGVWNMTLLFLEMWDFTCKIQTVFSEYSPYKYHPDAFKKVDGYVLPFGDNPMDDDLVGESVYMNILNHAKHYVYITTPYLILDSEMMNALCTSAKSGVDVRIITPHIPDKKLVFMVTRAYYDQLLRAGVRIYEFTPGFIHAKNFFSDDEVGVCGTINLDYRSLYHHFECGCWMYRTAAIDQMKQDYLDTLTQCQEITSDQFVKQSLYNRIKCGILRLFSPLL